MGLFSLNKTPKKVLPWVNITSTEQLTGILKNAGERPILLFKHSTRCSISSMALNSFERNWTEDMEYDLYFIDLLRNRDVSNEIEELTGIRHQSPQAIALRNQDVIYDAAHTAIDARKIETIISKG